MEKLQSVEMIPFDNFKEKMEITKKYYTKNKMEAVDNKYILLEREMEYENMAND